MSSPICGSLRIALPRGETGPLRSKHKGPYEEEGPTFEALMAWISENGYEIVGPVEEVYLNDPSVTAPQDLMTEIRFPVRKVR